MSSADTSYAFTYPGEPDRTPTSLDRRIVETVSEGLHRLTEALENSGCDAYGGGLGGTYGYGTAFENDVFGITPYCWCEEDDCPWCYGCHCPEDAYVYLVHGEPVSYEAYLAAGFENTQTHPVLEKLCDFCRTDPDIPPLFWHKPSGSTVSWYKYIGRGMEITLNTPWDAILRDCLASIPDRIDPQQRHVTAWHPGPGATETRP